MAHFVYTGLKANLPEVRENAFYLCTDTREIYFGADLFTEAVRTYTGEKPAIPATGVLYVNTDTKVGEIWTGSAWVQLFGGSSTDDIVFTEDLVFTYQFGKYTPVGGKVTVPAKDKTLTELLNDAFAEDQNPTVTQPSVTLTAAKIKAYEVGTKVSPDYSAVLNPGSYEFEPKATGIVVSAWKVTNTDGGEKTTASGTFDEIQVGDDTAYSITAEATYADGAMPQTALGKNYAAGQIKAGTKSATKSKISGYRNSFYGTLTAKEGEVNSALVRGLSGKSGRALAVGNSFSITIPVGAIRVVFAYPATLRDVNSVQDVNGMNAEIKSAFTKYTVDVEGANGYTAKSYKVYVMDMANANDASNTYKVTI